MAERELSPVAPTSSRETVLVADDEDSVRRALAAVLRLSGYAALPAAGHAEGLLLCQDRSRPIHLLIVDAGLPPPGAASLAEHVLAASPGARVLVVSGFPRHATDQTGLLAEAPFLPKPFELGTLLRAVRSVLDRPAGNGGG
jgi:two-component system, cell cycle sensor histidine kinase and response regulator CckA